MFRYKTTAVETVTCSGANPTPTSLTMAQRMICASISAYAVNYPYDPDKSDNFKPECLYWDPVDSVGTAHLITAKQSWDHPAVDAAFITQTKDNWIVLSLRGTEPPSSVSGIGTFIRFFEDWVQDAESSQVPFFVGRKYYGAVHNGFHKAFKAMLPEIKAVLDGIDWANVNGLQVTGHSKGAALTFLYALWARETYSNIKNVVVNAFAPPAVGNYHFIASYDGALNIETTCHMRHRDSVPFLLPFKTTEGADYDIYDYMHLGTSLTEDLFWGMGEFVHAGYEYTGTPIYYPGDVPGSTPCEKGLEALSKARWDVITAIKANQGKDIADAHSAKNSYYPAVMKCNL